jgi:hypothetical protein
MPKIFKHGSKWKFKREAYFGRKAKCKACGCIFELTPESKFEVYTGGKSGLSYCVCPECSQTEDFELVA